MKASDVIKIAQAELGYKEKATNSNLDDKTANAGSSNWTKYARDLAAAGYYNGNKNGYAWCDVFVDWCFFMASGRNAAEAQRVECQTGDCGAGCYYSKQYYKNKGRCDKTPRVGDQVFFQQSGEITHTGIVIEVSGSSVKTIEGNSSNMVAQRSYSLSNSYVDSFGHPLYEEEAPTGTGTSEASAETADTVRYGSAVTVSVNTLVKGSKGPQVRTLQRILRASGIDDDIEIDGSFGAITKAAVIALQKKLFPDTASEWDGEVGPKTWTAMLTKLN